jgi:CheY-like chemotaxis protein
MKQHILLIDDEQDELEILLEALKQIPVEDGFKCTYATNASHALIMLRYLVPDVIFVDMNMPGLNGLDFLMHIRGDGKLRNVRIFLFSNSITDNIREKATRLGATACINKAHSIQGLAGDLKNIFTDMIIHR